LFIAALAFVQPRSAHDDDDARVNQQVRSFFLGVEFLAEPDRFPHR
jgi:hypothetical protein